MSHTDSYISPFSRILKDTHLYDVKVSRGLSFSWNQPFFWKTLLFVWGCLIPRTHENMSLIYYTTSWISNVLAFFFLFFSLLILSSPSLPSFSLLSDTLCSIPPHTITDIPPAQAVANCRRRSADCAPSGAWRWAGAISPDGRRQMSIQEAIISTTKTGLMVI